MNVRWSTVARAQLDPRAAEKEFTDDDYVSFVRRFPPSKLVDLVATVAPECAFNQQDYAKNSLVTPWGLADIARVSLAFGNEHRSAVPSRDDLLRCLIMHNGLGHRGLTEKDPDPDAAANTMLQLAFYQFPHQRPPGAFIGRSLALFEQTPFPDQRPAEVMRSGWQQELLGCNLADYIGVTQLLAAAAKPNSGRFNPIWVENPEFPQLVRDVFDPAITRRMLTEFLSAPASSYRQRDRERPGVDRRFTFNPLVEFPVVAGLGPDLLMPVPDFVLGKSTPGGLYFTGLRRWGEAFTRDLGTLFEAYVGRHLALVPGATLHPEIQYGPGNDKSIDWVLVFPDLVLLVEAKLARPTQPFRSGAAGAAAAMQKAFDKAHKQLDRTYDLIMSRRPEFQHIPADRPIVGIVVTLEDFYLAGSPLHQPWYTKSKRLPTRAVSVEELETIVRLGKETATFLAANITMGTADANLGWALSKQQTDDNPIIRAGVEASPIFRIKESALDTDEHAEGERNRQ
ncbi:hypothetical protein SAMN04488544_3372 [Microlunatus sagamiharensis]|uniref:Nuclease-related domain-containing protein n=1 Tax=Microlunatus sagamiharensis TaxID=546874 RepID=A0A1H2N7L9_9ACTN|nr:hypothetical protein [Microlunatus sagamiharensis]SDV00776.1 hypothetical protein SAMN04488544_3372 [Microlunatus sagamiharensis]